MTRSAGKSVCRTSSRNFSAGGQLEQPWEVNNSRRIFLTGKVSAAAGLEKNREPTIKIRNRPPSQPSPSRGEGVSAEFFVGAVAEVPCACVFAAAPRELFFLSEGDFNRRESRAFVGSVAERLFFGPAAPAPEIIARLHFQNKRPGLGDDGIVQSCRE